MPWGEEMKAFLLLKDRGHTIIAQLFIREHFVSPFSKALSLPHAPPQQPAWLSSKSDLIKLSYNLSISCDPQGPGYWRFVEVALG